MNRYASILLCFLTTITHVDSSSSFRYLEVVNPIVPGAPNPSTGPKSSLGTAIPLDDHPWKTLDALNSTGVLEAAIYAMRLWNCDGRIVKVNKGEYKLLKGINYRLSVHVECPSSSGKMAIEGDFEVASFYGTSGHEVDTCLKGNENWITVTVNGRTACQTPQIHNSFKDDLSKIAPGQSSTILTKKDSDGTGGVLNGESVPVIVLVVVGAVVALVVVVAVAILFSNNGKTDKSDAEVNKKSSSPNNKTDSKDSSQHKSTGKTPTETKSLMTDSTKAEREGLDMEDIEI